jgi:hypothetical protein
MGVSMLYALSGRRRLWLPQWRAFWGTSMSDIQEAQSEINPEDWFLAVVDTVCPGYVFAVLSNGERVYIHQAFTQQREDGHSCLQVGDEVHVQMKPTNLNYEATYAVADKPLQPPTMTGRITRWDVVAGKGFVRLSCGCSIYTVARPDDFTSYEAGDVVTVGNVKENRDTGRYYFAIQMEERDL